MKKKLFILAVGALTITSLQAQKNYQEQNTDLRDSTRDAFSCGTSIVNDIDGNTYNTVLVGDQCWMKENLKVSKNPAGSTITRYCYSDNSANCDLYGGLYNWTTIMNGALSSSANPSGVQGICPDGWHIPSDAEYTQLTNYITGGASSGGNRLKSCRQVDSPLPGECNTTVHPRWDAHNFHYGTDDYGFSLLPAGHRYGAGIYDKSGQTTYIWSTTEYDASNSWYRDIYYSTANVYRTTGSKSYWFSVRCIRDIAIEQTLNLENIIVGEGVNICYNALQTINVSGLDVQSGGSLQLIAGQQINLFPQSTVASGAYFNASISTSGIFCNQVGNLLSALNEPDISVVDDYTLSNTLFKVHPNPTTGDFTLELSGFEEASILFVEIFSMQGHLITRKELPAQSLHKLTLAQRQPGIYLIRVLSGLNIETGKIIKQ